MDALRNALANYIAWIMAFHIIAVIAWMAGMLYLPRLFVYHTETTPGSEASERFKVMERQLLRGIINPGHDRGVDSGAAAGLADRRLSGHLAADQIRAGDHHERHARLSRALLAGFRRPTATPAAPASTGSSTKFRRC